MACQASAGCKFRRRPQLDPESPEDERSRNADSDANEGQDAGAPSIAQGFVQVWSEEGEGEASQAAEDSNGGHGTGGEARVAVDGVALHGLQTDHGAGREDDDADVGHDPVHAALHAPAVPEEANGNEKRADEHGRGAELGPANAAVLRLELAVNAVDEAQVDGEAHKRAQADGDVIEPADTEALAVYLAPNDRKRGKEQVVDSEEVGHVQRDDLDDWLGREHARRPHHGAADAAKEALGRAGASVQLVVAGLLDKAVPLPFQEGGRMRLAQPDQADYLDGASRSAGRPEHPAPCCFLGNPPSSYWSDDRTKDRRKRVDTHGLSALIWSPTVTEERHTIG